MRIAAGVLNRAGWRRFFWPIRHAKPGAKVLRKEHDCVLVLLRVLLDQVLHGFNQNALALNVPGVVILRSFAATTAPCRVRENRYSKDFGHVQLLETRARLLLLQELYWSTARK